MLPTEKSKVELDYLKKIYLIYGEPKVGKTTICSQFGGKESEVLFFASESGHKFQEVYKWKTTKGDEPTNWEHFKECCKELILDKDKHNYSCLVVDTVDNLYKWVTDYVNKRKGIEHESDLKFGKGYSAIKTEFMRPVLSLAQHGFGIIFISHAKDRDKEVGNVTINYTDTNLSGSAGKVISGLCDFILYFHLDLDGRRFIRTKGNKAVNAGDRSGKLPEIIEMDSTKLIKALKEAH